MRVVFDTNVLIDGFQDDFSYPARLLDAVRAGQLEAVTTPPVEREYRRILQRLIDDPAYRDRIAEFLTDAHHVAPAPVTATLDDPEDQKFLEAAAGATADAIITSDRHLLDVGEVGETRIVTPAEAWRQINEAGGSSEWQQWVEGIGL